MITSNSKSGFNKKDLTEQLAAKAGIGHPEVAIFEGAPNAFATGWNRNSALVAVSTGLLQQMNEAETEAVIGHEIAHIANGDMVTLTLIQGVVNTFVIFMARIAGHFVDRVILKNERGRSIGFPTANIALGSLQLPAFGVYSVEVDLEEDNAQVRQIGNGVANIGIRPTVQNRGVLCETHVFDRDLDLYNKRLLVRLKAFLRPERKFSCIEELIDQIGLDAEKARQLLPPFDFG